LRSLADAGKAVVMITHHMDEAARADRIWVLDGGVLAADDSPGTIFARERRLLRSLGLGLTGMAELACGLADRGVALPPEIVTIEDLVDYLCRVLKQKN
jgi:energy-coupling factor transport system ATP-binding protein